jgi:hypothetical protein
MWKIVKLMDVLNDVQNVMYDLTPDELDELINELKHVYERYNVYVQSRNGDKPE